MRIPWLKLGWLSSWGVAVVGMAAVMRFYVLPVVRHSQIELHKRQDQCRVNLEGFLEAQRAYMREKGHYTTSVMDLSFSPERDNWHAYFLSPGPLQQRSASGVQLAAQDTGIGVDTGKYSEEEKAAVPSYDRLPVRVRLELGLSGQCPQCDITMACMGQIDKDPTLDVWTISTRDRKDADGMDIPKGQLHNESDDYED